MARGGAFERTCSRLLTEWLTRWQEGEPRENPPEVWRSEMSGGVDWQKAVDLAPRNELGREFLDRFGVECKHRERPMIWGLWTGREPPRMIEYWRDTIEDCREYGGLCPLMMIRRTHRPATLVVHPRDLIPEEEHDFQWPVTIESEGIRLVSWQEWYDFPVERIYELHERWAESSDDGSGGGGS